MNITQGIDAGGSNIKVCDSSGIKKFVSLIGEYRDLKIGKLGPEDMVVEYEGKKYLSGPIVETECEHGGSMKGDTKAHFDAKLRILIAIHQTMQVSVEERRLVVGQPIGTHIDTEKAKIRSMLKNKHEITINGVKRSVYITDIEVAPEGAAAGLADPKQGWVRYIDLGSGTVNFGTTKDLKYVDRDSFTERYGAETTNSSDAVAYARKICMRALEKWKPEDYVRIVGGDATRIHPYITEYFPKAEILYPKYNGQHLDPIFGNVVAFYEIAKRIYR